VFEKSKNAIYSNDKILSFLFLKIFNKFGPIKGFSFLFFSPLIILYIIGFYETTLFNHIGFIGVIQDYTFLLALLIVPSTILSLYYFSKFVTFFFGKISSNNY
jgi:hypothetical protein